MLCALYAVAFVLLILIILLCINVNLNLNFDDETEFRCVISYLFFNFVLLPKDEEKERKKQEKKRRKQQKFLKKGKKFRGTNKLSFKDMFKEKGISGFLEDVKIIVSSLWSLILSVISRSVLENLELKMVVAGDDAADTAIIYGYTNAVVYPIVSAVIENVSDCVGYDVDISPDFSEEAEAKVSFCAHLRIKPVKLLAALLENRADAENLLNAVSKKSDDIKEK